MKINLFFTLFSIFLSPLVFSQTQDFNGTWLGANTKKEFRPGEEILMGGELRYRFDDGAMNQTIYTLGYSKKIRQSQSLASLYSYLGADNGKEHRLSIVHQMKWFSRFSQKIIIEHRDLEDNDDTSYRLRFKLGTSYKMLVVWNEIFLNLSREPWTGDKSIDRNRFYLGLKKEINGTLFSIGYMNQYVPRIGTDTNEHLLKVGLSL